MLKRPIRVFDRHLLIGRGIGQCGVVILLSCDPFRTLAADLALVVNLIHEACHRAFGVRTESGEGEVIDQGFGPRVRDFRLIGGIFFQAVALHGLIVGVDLLQCDRSESLFCERVLQFIQACLIRLVHGLAGRVVTFHCGLALHGVITTFRIPLQFS